MKTSEVVVLPYDKNWEFEFEKIKDQLIKALDDIIIGIEHVGGTSVKGLVGNPIIDIDIIIPTKSSVLSSKFTIITPSNSNPLA